MTPPAAPDRVPNTATSPRRVGAARAALVVAAGLFAAGVLGQTLTAGFAVFVGPGYWLRHREFVHHFEWLSVVAVILAHLGRVPRRLKGLAWLTVGLLFTQYATAGMLVRPGLERLAVLHPVGAMLLFWTAAELTRGAARARGASPHGEPSGTV